MTLLYSSPISESAFSPPGEAVRNVFMSRGGCEWQQNVWGHPFSSPKQEPKNRAKAACWTTQNTAPFGRVKDDWSSAFVQNPFRFIGCMEIPGRKGMLSGIADSSPYSGKINPWEKGGCKSIYSDETFGLIGSVSYRARLALRAVSSPDLAEDQIH